MASQTQGIQQLLSAEKRAAEKVSEARKRKNRRLKQAKEEAQSEIEKYKKEREQQVGSWTWHNTLNLFHLLVKRPLLHLVPFLAFRMTGREKRERGLSCIEKPVHFKKQHRLILRA